MVKVSIPKLFKIDNSIEPLQQFMIVGNCQQGGIMLFHGAKQQVQNPRLIFRIEVAGGLIGQNQPGPGQQRPANCGPLPFPLGQIGCLPFEFIADTHLLCQHPGSLSDSRVQLQSLRNPARVQNVVIDVEVIEKFKILKDKPNVGDPKLAPLGIVELIDGSMIDADASPARHDDSGDQVQQRGFPCAAGSDNCDFLMLINRKFGDMQSEIPDAIGKF